MPWSRTSLLALSLTVLLGCGEDAPASAPRREPAATSTPSVEPSEPAEGAVVATDEFLASATGSTDFAELVLQRAHRTIGASYVDPRGRYSLYWSRRVLAIHEGNLGRTRTSYVHGLGGDVFFTAYWPTLDPDVVIASSAAGGDPWPQYGGALFLVRVEAGEVVPFDAIDWLGVNPPTALGPARMLVGASIVDLRTGRVRALDRSATPEERGEGADEDEDAADEGAEDDEYVVDPAERTVCASVVSPDRRRIALFQSGGRILLYDATTLARTGVVPANVEEDPGTEGCMGRSDSLAYLPGSADLVAVRDEAPVVLVAPDGTLTTIALPEDAVSNRFVVSRDAPARIRFDGERAFTLPDGTEITEPLAEDTWREAIERDPWYGTANAYDDEHEAPADPPGGFGGEHAIWSVAFAPGPFLAVTAGRGGAYRWSSAGVEAIPCLTGEWPIEFAVDGRVYEPGGGRCDVRSGHGVAGRVNDPDSGEYYDQHCVDVLAEEAGGDAYFRLSEPTSYERPEGAPPPVWLEVRRPWCFEGDPPNGDDVPFANSVGADPTRAVFSEDDRLVAMPVPTGTRIWDVRTAQPLVTITGGAAMLGVSADGTFLFVRRERDAHVAVITRRGATTRLDAGPAPALDCEPRPIAERGGVIALHLESGVRLLDSATLAVRAEIDAPGTCTMELAGERVLVRRGEEVLAFTLDGAPAGTLGAPTDFRASDDGTALWRCADGVLDVRDVATGEPRARWAGECSDAVLSPDGRFALVRNVGLARVRAVRVTDGVSIVLGMHSIDHGTTRPFAFSPASGVFWAPDETPHDLFGVRLGPRVLDDPLVTGEEAWTRFHRATLVADFFDGRPLPTATPAP